MTVGIPGAGVGGLFYLLSALWMPFREIWRFRQGRSSRFSRTLVRRQFSIAVSILATMGTVAWFLAAILTPRAGSASFIAKAAEFRLHHKLPAFPGYTTFGISAITLLLIIGSVHLLRLVLQTKPHDRVLFLALFLILPSAALGATQQTVDANPELVEHLRRGEAAFRDEDAPTAEKEFRVVLRLNPKHSKAVFRLAQLMEHRDPSESRGLFEKYIALEPEDPWGYIVFAEALGRRGFYKQALYLYSDAWRLAPEERDAAVGRARMLSRAGRTDEAAAAYEDWLKSHPADAEAWAGLASAQQRAGRLKSARLSLDRAERILPDTTNEERLENLQRLGAPAFEPTFTFGSDSDGNNRMRTAIAGDFAPADTTRIGLTVGRTKLSDAFQTQHFSEFGVNTRWRPRAAVRVDAGVGAVDLGALPVPSGARAASSMIPTARLRVRANAPGDAARFDLRFNRTLLDSTPLLLANRMVRDEFQVRPDVALSDRFRLRPVGGAGWIHGGGEERNSRSTAGGGAAWKLAPSAELSANFTQVGYRHASSAGYFAPQRIQTVEGGSYLEFETGRASIALDLGAGAERLKTHDSSFGQWRPVLRGYALMSFRLTPGREIRIELDGYNTQAGTVQAVTPGWKSGSATVSLRWALF